MKKLLVTLGCIVLVVIIVLAVAVLNLGPIVKTAVNSYGPGITKTAVRVGEADVSVLSGQARLKHFILGNPQGFATPQAIRVGSIFVDVDESSLTKDTIVIDRIEVDNPEITYEIKGRTDNFRALMDNMKGTATRKEAPKKKGTAEKKGKKLLIKDFIIKGGRVNMAVTALKGKVVTASLPDIHLKNIGQGENGARPAEVFMQVFDAVYGKITSPDLTKEFAKQLKGLGVEFKGIGQDVRQQLKGTTDNLTGVKKELKGIKEQFKGLFNK